MTPEQQAILDKLKEVLDPKTFLVIKVILLRLWTGGFEAAGYGEFVAKLLLEWAAKQGTWMYLTIKDALGLSQSTEVAVVAEGSTLSAIALSLLPLVLLLGGGLLLPASKLGKIEWDWGGWWRDPCEDNFSNLTDDYTTHDVARGEFPTGASRQSVMNLLGQASSLINECDEWLQHCPNSKRAATVRKMREKAEKARDEYLDWLAKH